jgi:hypothetical protein
MGMLMVLDESDDGGRRYGLVMRALGVSAAFYEYRARLGSKGEACTHIRSRGEGSQTPCGTLGCRR